MFEVVQDLSKVVVIDCVVGDTRHGFENAVWADKGNNKLPKSILDIPDVAGLQRL